MWISKVRFAAAATVIIAALGAGTGVVTHRVMARDVANPGAPAEGKKGGPAGDGIHWNATVVSINADSIVVGLAVTVKGSVPVTLKLANDVKVELAGFKDKTPKPAKIADVTAGASVTLELSPDKTTVNRIELGPSHMNGRIQSIDAAHHAITVVSKGKAEATEKTLPVSEDARIVYGGNKTKSDMAEAKFGDLAAEQPISAQIAPDGANFIEITIEGENAGGRVVSVDPAKKTITVSSKGENGLTNRTFTIDSDTSIYIGEGKFGGQAGSIADVSEGMGIALQLSPRGAKPVISVRAWNMAPAKEKGK